MARFGEIGVLVAVLLNAASASTACGGIVTEACLEGTEACICRSDGSCDSGLSCRSNLCVDPNGDGTGGRVIVNEPAGSGGAGASPPIGLGGAGASPPIGLGGSAAGHCLPGRPEACIGPGNCAGTRVCLPDGGSFGPCTCPTPLPICNPGQMQSCLGPGACIGSQSCLPDGTGFGVCACPASASGGTGGAVVQICAPNTVTPCYGPANCLGSQRCLPDGSAYAPCDCGTGGGTSVLDSLLPSDGYIEGGGVDGRIWGAWYTFGGLDSVFNPPEGEPVFAQNDHICFSGTVAQVIGGDYSTYYGAAIGFDLCGMPADMSTCDEWMPPEYCSWAPESRHTITECSIGVNLISFDITGQLPSTELRVQFKERDRDESTYLAVFGTGHFVGVLSDATVGYDSSAPPLDQSSLEAIHFLVASTEAGPVTFGFCIGNLQIE